MVSISRHSISLGQNAVMLATIPSLTNRGYTACGLIIPICHYSLGKHNDDPTPCLLCRNTNREYGIQLIKRWINFREKDRQMNEANKVFYISRNTPHINMDTEKSETQMAAQVA